MRHFCVVLATFVCVLLGGLALAIAASTAAADTRIGLVGGWSFSNLSIDGQSGLEGRSSFAAGAVVDYGLDERWGIRVEPTWMSRGGKATKRNAYWGSIDGVVFQLDCIDVPVLARYDLGTSADRGYLLGGLDVSFATKSEAKITQAHATEKVDFGDVFNPVDVGVDAGAGMAFDMGGDGRLGVDARFTYGLTNINGGGTVTYQGSPLDVPSTSTHNYDFRLMATYFFPRAGK